MSHCLVTAGALVPGELVACRVHGSAPEVRALSSSATEAFIASITERFIGSLALVRGAGIVARKLRSSLFEMPSSSATSSGCRPETRRCFYRLGLGALSFGLGALPGGFGLGKPGHGPGERARRGSTGR